MKRYTSKALESDVARMNETLELCRSDFRMLVGGRYGYTAIDLYRPEVYRDCGGIQRTLETGSPRECLAAAELFVSQQRAENQPSCPDDCEELEGEAFGEPAILFVRHDGHVRGYRRPVEV